MSSRIKLVQGDTRPQLRVTITEESANCCQSDGGTEINLEGTTCIMKFREAGSTTVLDTLNGFVTDGPGGVVVFPWNSTTLEVPEGDYEGEIEIVFPNGGGKQTVYELLKFRVREDF